MVYIQLDHIEWVCCNKCGSLDIVLTQDQIGDVTDLNRAMDRRIVAQCKRCSDKTDIGESMTIGINTIAISIDWRHRPHGTPYVLKKEKTHEMCENRNVIFQLWKGAGDRINMVGSLKDLYLQYCEKYKNEPEDLYFVYSDSPVSKNGDINLILIPNYVE